MASVRKNRYGIRENRARQWLLAEERNLDWIARRWGRSNRSLRAMLNARRPSYDELRTIVPCMLLTFG